MYTALFVKDIDSLLKRFPPKHKKIFAHHSTIEFEPTHSNDLEIGKELTIQIIGRAWDEYGDDLLVENPKSKNKYPHITLSRAENAPPLYSHILFGKQPNENHMEYFDSETVDVVEGYSDDHRVII